MRRPKGRDGPASAAPPPKQTSTRVVLQGCQAAPIRAGNQSGGSCKRVLEVEGPEQAARRRARTRKRNERRKRVKAAKAAAQGTGGEGFRRGNPTVPCLSNLT